MSSRGIKRRKPAASAIAGPSTLPTAVSEEHDELAVASRSSSRRPISSRRSSVATVESATATSNNYGTRSRIPTNNTNDAPPTTTTSSRAGSRTPLKRDASEATASAEGKRSTTASRKKRDLASQFEEVEQQEEEEGRETDAMKVDEEQAVQGESEEARKECEAKTQAMEEMWQRWNEEYFEIVEQLPLEMHRSFALMRELEVKLQNRIKSINKDARSYRDARLALRAYVEARQAAAADTTVTSADAAAAAPPSQQQLQDGDETVMEDVQTPATEPTSGSIDKGKAKAMELDPLPLDQALTPPSESISQPTSNAVPSTSGAPPTELTSRAARLALLRNVSRSVNDGIRAAEEKVGLAVTAYDWVDRHIRRLDGDLQKSESSLLLGLRAGTEASRGVREALGMDEEQAAAAVAQARKEREEGTSTRGGTPVAAVFDFTQKGAARRNGKSRARGGEAIPRSLLASARNTPQEAGKTADAEEEEEAKNLVPDMAIDPNEPRYCYCDQVSFGDMIACDNDDCPREWYHYNCVGLSSVPRGRWYCLFCAPAGWKGPGNEVPQGARYAPPGHNKKGKR